MEHNKTLLDMFVGKVLRAYEVDLEFLILIFDNGEGKDMKFHIPITKQNATR